MQRTNSGRRVLMAVAAATPLLAAALTGVAAQSVDCARLRAQIDSLGRHRAGRSSGYERAAQRQRALVARYQAYARSLNCGEGHFLFFGGSESPQCGSLQAQIAQMTANLQALENASSEASGETLRNDLLDRFNSSCRGATPRAQGGPFDFLFGSREAAQDPRQDPRQDVPDDSAGDDAPHASHSSGNKAVCVRLCDGSFFPVSYTALSHDAQELGDMCHALCPSTETAVYSYSIYGDIGTAVTADGSSYADLPNAFRYTKSYDAACTCRPSGRSWVQTLAEAESLLAKHKNDVIVTPEKSAELARPLGQRTAAGAPHAADDPTAAEGALGAHVPTASKDSAGINVGRSTAASTYGETQGDTRELMGPDGAKRQVRVIAPSL